MSQDLGDVAAGFQNNFAYGTIALSNGTYVQLVDNSQNVPEAGSEALYVNALIVPAGCTLDLSGLHVYAREMQIDGTVAGGNVNQFPPGGAIGLGTPTPGLINKSSPTNDWTFYGQAGQTVAIVANTGTAGSIAPLQPSINFAEVQLLDPSGNVVASGANTQSGADATLLDVQLPSTGAYTIQFQAAPSQPSSTGYYLVAVWDGTVFQNALNMGQTENGELESPYQSAQWDFTAAANEQINFSLLASSNPGLEYDLTGPNNATIFSDLTASSGLVTLPAAGSYVLTAHWAQPIPGETGAFAFEVNETPQSALTTGTPYQGTLSGSGQAQLFTVTITSPTALSIVLTDANASDENEVYASLGNAPTRDSYQYRYTATGANQSLVQGAQPGTYYILVYDNLVTNPGSDFTLDVQAGPFVLSGLTPGQIGNGQASTLLVAGVFPLEYQSSTAYQIQLVSPTGAVYPASPLYLAPTSLTTSQTVSGTTTMSATLPANALPAGTYSVLVTDNLGNTQSLPSALTVTAGGVGVLKTSISVPNPIGYHEPSTLYVEYSNVGTAPMPAPLLELTATQNGEQGAFLSLNPADAGLAYASDTTPAGFSQTVQFLASGAVPGILEPGESVTVPVYYAGWLTSQWEVYTRPPIYFTVSDLETNNTAGNRLGLTRSSDAAELHQPGRLERDLPDIGDRARIYLGPVPPDTR